MVSAQKVDYFLLSRPHLSIDGHWSVEDAMHAKNGWLWGVDDGRAKHGPKHTTVANGERSSIHIFNSELIVTSLRSKESKASQNCGIIKKKSLQFKAFTFSPRALMAFSISAKFMASTLRSTGTTSPYKANGMKQWNYIKCSLSQSKPEFSSVSLDF